jgi:hypothetical protein
LNWIVLARLGGLALMSIELLLYDRLRSRLLSRRLMFCHELDLAGFTDSDDRNILHSLDDPKVALGHEHSVPQFLVTSARHALARVKLVQSPGVI